VEQRANIVSPHPRERFSPSLAAAAIALLAALSYLNILGNGFTLDDFGLIVHSRAVQLGDWRFLLANDYWAAFDGRSSGLYRPLTSLLFSLQYALGAGSPFLFHLFSLLLHALVSLLVWRLSTHLAGTSAGFMSAALFAVHPAHAEAVAAIAGQADLLSTGGTLLALLCAWQTRFGDRRWSLGTALGLGLGLLAKEQTIVLPGLLLALDWYLYKNGSLQRLPWREYALCTAVVALYLALRYSVLGGWQIGYIDPLDNPLVTLPLPQRLGNAALVAWRYLGLLVLPYKLSADYSYNALPTADLWPLALAGALLLLTAGALLLYKFHRHPDLRSLGALWMLLAFAPVANIAFPIGTIFAERLLYLPSLGFCFVFAVALNQAWNAGRRRLSLAIFVVLVLGLTNRTWMRNADWRDNETLFHAAIHTYPQSAKAHAGLGQALLDRGDTIGALNSLERALSIYPDYAAAHYNTGVAYLALRQWEHALDAFTRAETLNPDHAQAALNRGVALWELGRYSEAVAAYEQALRLKPDFAAALENLQKARRSLETENL
jgi:protein O-mannosyl-transferase